GENNRTAAFRSIEEICRLAAPIGVRVALEVIPNEISDAHALVTLLEQDLDSPQAGICLDFGHAFLMGDVPDAVETVAEHLITTHVHDNKRKNDNHPVPSEGKMDWAAALMSMQRIGFAGTSLLGLQIRARPERCSSRRGGPASGSRN